ncbi:MFS transporter [Gordonia sp. HS-NH1]|uniref:MFS transporter n=1 Tax=Gordonia sp. HS-NH1 TaxID=1435068 RepID=UPI0006E31896|nr:MFS transporter [Gordonia sp. HS-NH1]
MTTAPSAVHGTSQAASRRQVRLVVATVFLTYTAMMVMTPLIAPLSREIGIAEWQVGLVVSTAAACIAVAGPIWGRLSQRVGPKRILTATVASGTCAMVVFAAAAQAGVEGALSAGAVFVVMLLVRGVWFGLSEAAVIPTAQAYIASVTPTVDERVRGVAAIGAATGTSMIVGAAAGGLLGGVSTLVPLWAVPVMLAATLLVIVIALRPAEPAEETVAPRRVSFTDQRVWPFLLISFGLFTALGFIQILVGFLVQDRLALDTEQATLITGIALLIAGVGLVISQGIAVPRLHWSPVRYIRVGALIALGGFCLLVPDWGALGLLVAIFLIGVGLGMAAPGYTAGASLAVTADEQGSVAGLVAATNALTFIVAPAAATALYETSQQAPLVAATVTTLLIAVFAFTHPRLRVTTGA